VPHLPSLRKSVIHNDGNDHNLLITDRDQVAGLIDFGDMLHTCTVNELAVALAYAMLGRADPLAIASPVIAGYHQVRPIMEPELALLYYLVCARLCISVSVSAYRKRLAPDNDYLTVTEEPGWTLLAQLAEIGPDLAHYAFRHACSLPPCPAGTALTGWLQRNGGKSGPILPHTMNQALVFDLSVGSLEIGGLDELDDAQAFTARLFERLTASGAQVGVGPYDEARLLYRGDAFKSAGNDREEWRSVHIGLDLFAEPGTPVFAPLDSKIHSFQDNAAHLDYGPTIILEHETENGPFYTLYGHLSVASLQGLREGMVVSQGDPLARIGDIDVNGGWPPHLHFQIVADLLGRRGEYPGVAPASQREIWLSICPDPNLLLRIPAERFPKARATPKQILKDRSRSLGPSLSISYRKPLNIVRGWRQYLYDESGQPYLDGVNNVCHVGHCHPRVTQALLRQAAVLNTNTRYLHESIVGYAQRLGATLPEPLRVCFFVCSGSEANELALRMARAYTGQKGFVVLEGAYHGNTSSLIDISPYKFDGPGGNAQPPHVRQVPMPDLYRGLYRSGAVDPAGAYARHVKGAIASLEENSQGIAAIICESLLGCGGQIVLPDGYLRQAFQYVHDAGGICIADEVQVGFGRLGSHFWGFQSQDVVPDIVTMGKPMGNGHPLAAVITTPEIASAFANGMEYFNTFGGNPVSCAVGMAVLDVIEEENLQQNALQVGESLMSGLARLKQKYVLVGDVRGRGLFLGIELVRDPASLLPATAEAAYVAERMRDHGILLSTDGPDHNVLKIKPPIIFSEGDASQMITALDRILAEDFLQLARGPRLHSSSRITGS
jgi:4-aminobutyrate aminotransferase-like enzyme